MVPIDRDPIRALEMRAQAKSPFEMSRQRLLLFLPVPISESHAFLPGDLTRQLLDSVKEGVSRPPVQGLWAEQGHTPAGRAPPGLLPEERKDAGEHGVRSSKLDV